jgi:flagellar biosynthesis chaperone FliJ
MAGFQFRLQPLLDQRTEEKKMADDMLHARERELSAELVIMQQLEEEVRRAERNYQSERMKRLAVGTAKGSAFVRQGDLLLGLKQDVQAAYSGVFAQQVFLDQATGAVDEARAELKERQRDLDVLEKYRDKVEKRFSQKAAYREELEQDEIGNAMHLSRRQTK